MSEKQTLSEQFEAFFQQSVLQLSDIPNLDLYIDQIITMVDDKTTGMGKKDPDKLLTKAMVNNYSKEKIIQPTKGKKYSKEQIIRILLICYLKQTLSIQDIKVLLSQVSDVQETEMLYTYFLEERAKILKTLKNNCQGQLAGLDEQDRETSLRCAMHLAILSAYTKSLSEMILQTCVDRSEAATE